MNSQREGNAKLAKTIRSSYASSLLTSENASNSFDEINAIAELVENSPSNGRVVIELDAAINGDPESNILLDPGDSLFIPKAINTVSVIGEVNSSNSNLYNPALSTKDYISLSGGFSSRADKDNLYIIKANGSVIPLTKSLFGLGLSTYKIQKGDTIVVPVKASYTDNLSLWSEISQVIYNSLVSLAALDRITD